VSPGFRQSVEPTPVVPTEPEETVTSPIESHRSSTPVARAETLKPSSPPSSTHSPERYAKHPSRGSHLIPPSPSTSKTPTDFVSPLERRPTPVDINQSITGLSLGGEALGGWQSDRGAWGDQTEDDSDDDKPISQTVKLPDHGDNKLVSGDVGISFALNVYSQTTTARDGNGIQPVFVITVDDPQKVGDPIRSFTMYTVHTRVGTNIIYLPYVILTVVYADNFTTVPKIRLLCSPTLFRLPMALRNSFQQQPRCHGPSSSRKESLWTI
jgi:sorting nexin-1/2